MSIEYAIDYDADGQLTVYRGETRNQESVLYKIEKGTVIGEDSCYVRTYPDKRIAYTAVADPSYPGSYRIYEGDDYTYGGKVAFFYHSTEPFDIIRKGDSVYGDELYILRPGKASRYVIEKRETLSSAREDGGTSGPAPSRGNAPSDSGIFGIILVIIGVIAFFVWSGFNAVIFFVLLPVLGFMLGTKLKKKMVLEKAKKDIAREDPAENAASGEIPSAETATVREEPGKQSVPVSSEVRPFIHVCPSCGAKSRFPSGIGTVSYTCPRCGSLNEIDTGSAGEDSV